MVNINIEVEDEAHKEAKINSLKSGMTLKEYVQRAIEEKLKEE